ILGFGGSEIGYQQASPAAVSRLLGRALDAGLNVIDTAECYEESEALIGKALGARRHDCYLFTKCGHADGWGRPSFRPARLPSSRPASEPGGGPGPPPSPCSSSPAARSPTSGAAT